MSCDDGCPTATSEEQREVEMEVLKQFGRVINSPSFDPETSFILHRESHIAFLRRGLAEPLKPGFISLEASRPWICYWILHALDLLGARDLILAEFGESVPKFLSACQHPSGGFGGSPGQIPHLATTYAAVSALVCIGTDRALSLIDRAGIKRFLLAMKDPVSGGFHMHENGELDMRGTYCAVAVGSLLHLLDETLTSGVGEFVRSCQTYEGGIAGEPDMEAHGGYSYCGLAALAILGNVKEFINTKEYLRWVQGRQMKYEGGFQGRINKLVDSCYTFWQGAAFPILARVDPEHAKNELQAEAAQMYVLLACQVETGGLRDKPGKSPDFYHSCYALSGLAALQYPADNEERILGPKSNRLERNCVLFNNACDRIVFARNFFTNSRPVIGSEGGGVNLFYGRKGSF